MSHNSSKTWDLAERSRKISKGQAKIFLTRSAGEEQRLAKLTHHLDKEKAAKESQLSHAQKLLMKRYGAAKVVEGGGGDSRWSARDRSHTYDPIFITRACEGKETCPEITGRARAASGSSCDLEDDGKSSGKTRGLADIPRVHSQGNVSAGKDKDSVGTSRNTSLSIEDLLRSRLANFSESDGEIYKNLNRSPKTDDQERRPRALSEILPPIRLPPIFKVDENAKMTGKMNPGHNGVLGAGDHKISVPGQTSSQVKVNELNGQNKALIGHTHFGTKKTIKDDKTMNYELDECRYLRTRNLEKTDFDLSTGYKGRDRHFEN